MTITGNTRNYSRLVFIKKIIVVLQVLHCMQNIYDTNENKAGRTKQQTNGYNFKRPKFFYGQESQRMLFRQIFLLTRSEINEVLRAIAALRAQQQLKMNNLSQMYDIIGQ